MRPTLDKSTTPIVTITTDFGEHFATAQMEGVLLGINPTVKIVNITDHVRPFNILEGSFILMQTSRFFPSGTIHVAIVDPGVGSKRRGLVIKTHKSYFIGPDNGLFMPIIKNQVFEWAIAIDEEHFPNKSNTFHGRDVFIKIAGFLSRGDDVSKLGDKIDLAALVPMDLHLDQIVHIDGFGNIKINRAALTVPFGTVVPVVHKEREFTARYERTFSDVGIGEWVLAVGSHDVLELAMNQGNASKVLGARVGDVVSVTEPDNVSSQTGPTLFEINN